MREGGREGGREKGEDLSKTTSLLSSVCNWYYQDYLPRLFTDDPRDLALYWNKVLVMEHVVFCWKDSCSYSRVAFLVFFSVAGAGQKVGPDI